MSDLEPTDEQRAWARSVWDKITAPSDRSPDERVEELARELATRENEC